MIDLYLENDSINEELVPFLYSSSQDNNQNCEQQGTICTEDQQQQQQLKDDYEYLKRLRLS